MDAPPQDFFDNVQLGFVEIVFPTVDPIYISDSSCLTCHSLTTDGDVPLHDDEVLPEDGGKCKLHATSREVGFSTVGFRCDLCTKTLGKK